MPKTWYEIKALETGDTAEISILDEIGFWGVRAEDFIRDLRNVQAPKISLVINSPGGSVFDALAIFNALRATGKTIEVRVLGIAASAASYLAMAGDKVTMPENTFMFLHNPINAVYGNAEDMREMADVLDKIGASLTATYAKRWKGEEQALLDVLAAETYLTAAECLEYGLADEVTPAITASARFDTERLPQNVRAMFTVAAQPAPLAPALAAAAKQHDVEDLVPLLATRADLSDEQSFRSAVSLAGDIKRFAALAGHPEAAADLVRAGKSLPEARAALAMLQVEADAKARVDTAPPKQGDNKPVGADRISATSIWNDIKAMQAGSKK